MAEIEPRIFRKDNLRMSAEHFDEGVPPDNIEDISSIDRHMHDLGVCKDEEGRYCGNLIDSKLLININNAFPRMMRERGWDMDDLDTTDFERAKSDKDYAMERNAKRRQSGLSVNKHVSRKSKAAQAEAAEIIQQALQVNRDATDRMNLAGELMLEAEAQQQFARMKLQEIEEKETALKHRAQELDEIVRLGRRVKAEQLSEGIMKKKTDRDSAARKLPEISY
ncbi:MAG: hypothetical protein J6M92_16055 [Oribacterium sp.]|nr:hypothetical protein [Oribacterium sp.]